jgi:hypothetical protein
MGTRTALVCGKWRLPITTGGPRPASMKAHALKGYHQFISGRSRETGLNALGIEWLCGMLPTGGTVCEPFGGVGVFATVIQGVLRPSRHIMYDIDATCLDQLKRAFGDRPGTEIRYGDATIMMGQDRADAYVIDFPYFTIKQYWSWDPHWSLMTFRKPHGIIWLDGSARYLHVNARTYGADFGRTIEDADTYIQAMNDFMRDRHGYGIAAVAQSHSCFYFLATPNAQGRPVVRRFRDGDDGFRWVD